MLLSFLVCCIIIINTTRWRSRYPTLFARHTLQISISRFALKKTFLSFKYAREECIQENKPDFVKHQDKKFFKKRTIKGGTVVLLLHFLEVWISCYPFEEKLSLMSEACVKTGVHK